MRSDIGLSYIFKGSAASGSALASGSRDTALTIRLTWFSDIDTMRHTGLCRQEHHLVPPAPQDNPVRATGSVETAVEIADRPSATLSEPRFIRVFQIRNLRKKIFICTNHGR